jgi:transcriptional regulator with XRE-family HTH domain
MIAQQLKHARRTRGWTRARLCAESGVHPNTIADIEHGRNRRPSFETVFRLARALGFPPEQLYPIADTPSGPSPRARR